MKSEIRTIGWDDSPHTRADGRVPLVGVHMRGATRVDSILTTDVARDGGDSTNRVARAVIDSGLRGTKAMLLDGASFAGFNVVDLEGLAQETGVPCISVTKGAPDITAMRAAIQNVPDPEAKWALIERRKRFIIESEAGKITVSYAGVGEREVAEILALTTQQGAIPEPLRLAHMIAALVK